MPYFDHNMASSICDGGGGGGGASMKAGKVFRTVPSCSKSSKQPDTPPDEKYSAEYKVDLDLRKLMFMRNLLKAEVIFGHYCK